MKKLICAQFWARKDVTERPSRLLHLIPYFVCSAGHFPPSLPRSRAEEALKAAQEAAAAAERAAQMEAEEVERALVDTTMASVASEPAPNTKRPSGILKNAGGSVGGMKKGSVKAKPKMTAKERKERNVSDAESMRTDRC